ncbi:hypothetical protein BCBD1442_20890 [Brucella ceti]|nr:hypothetical protein BCBD1442_20890 [Brucella ceti]
MHSGWIMLLKCRPSRKEWAGSRQAAWEIWVDRGFPVERGSKNGSVRPVAEAACNIDVSGVAKIDKA